MGSPVSISGLNHLNALPQLTELNAMLINVEPDEPPLDIPGLTHLEKLSIQVSPRSPAGIRDRDLVCLGNLKDLKWLQIGRTEITDEGMAHLVGLTAMERLGIGSPQLTDKALSYLANMWKLNHLRIVGDFSDNGLRQLEGLEALGWVSITSEDAFDPAALQRLREQLPNLGYLKAIP
jgi:internalin A